MTQQRPGYVEKPVTRQSQVNQALNARGVNARLMLHRDGGWCFSDGQKWVSRVYQVTNPLTYTVGQWMNFYDEARLELIGTPDPVPERSKLFKRILP